MEEALNLSSDRLLDDDFLHLQAALAPLHTAGKLESCPNTTKFRVKTKDYKLHSVY